jgi:hypothetical protein
MKISITASFFVGLCLANSPAVAQSVADIPTIYDWEQANHTPSTLAANANFERYSSTISTGGGQFVIGATGCTGDGGVIIADTHNPTNCYYRQFSGPVHLPWYGVPDAGTCWTSGGGFPTSCDATTKVNNALAAAKIYGDGGVTTDGRSIAILSHCGGCIDTSSGIAIPQDQYLTCEGPQGARRDWTTDPWLPPYPPRTMLENLLQANVMEFSSSHKSTTVETAV